MEQIHLEEVSRRSIRISKLLETTVSWGKGPLSVITDKGLSVFEFSYDLSLWDKNIALSETAIPASKSSPASKLLVAATRGQVINNLMVNQMIIDPVFWPHNDKLVKELAAVTAHQYSPPEFIFNNECLLATLTNIGNVNLFTRKRHCWSDVFDLSALLDNKLELKAEWDFGNSTNILDPLRQASSALQSCAFCWGSYDPSNKSCFFVTAQRNGDIVFWKLIKEMDILKAELLTRQNVETSEIVSIHWITRTDQTFFLIYSNILGQLNSLECTKARESVTVTKRNTLWKHQDRMIVKILKHKSSKDGQLQCIFAKHRHLIIQVINNSGELLSQFHNNVNDNKITSIFQFKSDFYLCTENFCVFKIIITGGHNNISAEFVPIIYKDTYPMHNLYGIAVSRNDAFWALAMMSRKVESRKSQQCLNIVFFSPGNDKNTLAQLLSNPTRSLREMWDCIELQRYKTVKTKKTLPEYNKMSSEAQTEPYLLKLYMIFLNLQENLESICKSTNKDLLPEKSCVTVKELLLFQHAIKLVQNLFSKFKMFNNLSEFDEETFAGAKHYLGYYCLKYKYDITEILAPEILQRQLKHHSEWMCELCGEYLEGFLCKNGHINSYCSLTFTLINSNKYLSCCRCKATARVELYPDNPTCIFCDLYLNMS